MPIVTFIRGLPGSGKTTLAKRFCNVGNLAEGNPGIYAADDWFTGSDGSYHFDPVRLTEAHSHCQNMAAGCLNLGYNCVVTNTFSRKWELVQYLEALDLLTDGFQFTVIDLFDAGLSDEQLAARCVHGVPVEKIAQMRARWET